MGSIGHQQLRGALVLAGTVALVAVTVPAVAAPTTPYQMPFPCGQEWTGTTRSNHSPSSRAIDWNRSGDLNKSVVAAAPGVVTKAVTSGRTGYGRYIILDHGKRESTLYAHLNAVSVKVGQRVKQAQHIGRVGSSGNSTGPHLHFEERSGSTVVQPFLNGVRFTFGSTLKSKNCPTSGGGGGEEDPKPFDVPLAEDWHGTDKAQLAGFRRATPAEFVIQRPNPAQAPLVVKIGQKTDEPVPGDWDGNGAANVGVFRPSIGTFILRSPGTGVRRVKFGQKGHQPLSGDWNGDGVTDLGIRIKSNSAFRLRRPNGTTALVRLGDPDDIAVTGDWDRDGITDVGVFDQATATFSLRRVDEEGVPWIAKVKFGKRGDIPVTGDWDGDGRDDLGVWTPGTGKFSQRFADAPTNLRARKVETSTFGAVSP